MIQCDDDDDEGDDCEGIMRRIGLKCMEWEERWGQIDCFHVCVR